MNFRPLTRTALTVAVLTSGLMNTGFTPQGPSQPVQTTPVAMQITFTTVKKPLAALVKAAAKPVKDAKGKLVMPEFVLIPSQEEKGVASKARGFVISAPVVRTLAGMSANVSLRGGDPSENDEYSYTVVPAVDRVARTYGGDFEIEYRSATLPAKTTKLSVKFPQGSTLGLAVSPTVTLMVKMAVVDAD